MNQKEFNIVLKDASNELNPLNQLLYQTLVLIVIYNLFDRIENIKKHKSFILISFSYNYYIRFRYVE